MCHESTSIALAESIGIGKASVTLEDVHNASLLVLAGQNPGTNHPRMLSALEEAKRRGAKILAINPLREAGLVGLQEPADGPEAGSVRAPTWPTCICRSGSTATWPCSRPSVRCWSTGTRSTTTSSPTHTTGFPAWRDHRPTARLGSGARGHGLARSQIVEAAAMLRDSDATVFCWAMGLTQHRNAVATIKEIANLAFAQGNIGKPGAGLLPVRGHSNVQGDRTMGIWERPPEHFLDALQAEFGFDPPRKHGYDTVDAIRAMRDGHAHVFIGLGGNFVQAAPDTTVTADALRRTRLTVQISTKINRSHLVCGETALILPTLGRTENDVQASGEQVVTVEDSTCSVHASRGPLPPASPQLRSEVAIVTGIAERTLGDRYGIGWAAFRDDYRRIRRRIAKVVPGCASYETNASRPGGFVMPHPPRDSRTFPTKSGRAEFAVSPIEVLQLEPGQLILQTLRSHDQFNTTIYGLDDRYRGVKGGRLVVFVHPRDLADFGLQDGDLVDLVGHWAGDDHERRARRLPGGGLPDTARVRRGVLPGDQRAGSARLHRRRQQHPGLQVGDHLPGTRRVRAVPRRPAAGRTRPGPTRATRAAQNRASSPSGRDNVLGVSDSSDVTAARALLFDAFSRVRDGVVELTDGLDDATATYRPDPGANTIAWLIWHLTRTEDESIADLAGTDPVWPRWRDRFALPIDDDATGYGMTPEEVGEVKASADLLAGYHAEVHEATKRYLDGLTAEELERVVDRNWDPPVTAAVRLVSVIDDEAMHIGQAGYVKGMAERAADADGEAMTASPVEHRFYGDLAPWWPLISPPAEYADEADFAAALLDPDRRRAPPSRARARLRWRPSGQPSHGPVRPDAGRPLGVDAGGVPSAQPDRQPPRRRHAHRTARCASSTRSSSTTRSTT